MKTKKANGKVAGKPKALRAKAAEPRSAAAQTAAEKATVATEHNNNLLQKVWAGQKGKAALMYEDQGGEAKRVGWPNGYKAELDKSVVAHEKLFSRKPPAPEDGARPKRGRPAGAATRGNGAFDKSAKIKLLVKENPKRPGSSSYDVWKMYEDGMTVEAYFAKGGRSASLKWDSEHEFISIG